MKRSHLMLIRVSFDKPITATNARKEVRENLQGNNYYTSYESDRYPGEFKIRAVKAPPR